MRLRKKSKNINTIKPEEIDFRLFHGEILKSGSEVRINDVVHLKSVLPENTAVPINWIAIGDPVVLLPPQKYEEIWKIQEPLNFPKTAYGIDRPKTGEANNMVAICLEMSLRLSTHFNDKILPENYKDKVLKNDGN